ncbi:MAG: hypothetical protein AAGM33_01865 [Pseudomonadota bacterium]
MPCSVDQEKCGFPRILFVFIRHFLDQAKFSLYVLTDGQRWAPVHGLLPQSRAKGCYDAVIALFASHKEEMDRLGVFTGTLVS